MQVKTARFDLRIAPKHKERLDQLAKTEGLSKADYIVKKLKLDK